MRKRRKKKISNKNLFLIIIIIILILSSFTDFSTFLSEQFKNINYSYSLENIPPYHGNLSVILNNNVPNFSESEENMPILESYSDLDYLNRCGVAIAKVGIETMPTKERESIGMVKPSGWHTIKYDFVDGKYLYNRCHLIGYQLTGENANEKNLITCTRSMNTLGMLPYENKVSEYVKKTKNHVLYKVTPIFEGNNLVASGVTIEAKSIEDDSLAFNVFVYNVEDGVTINYLDGTSSIS